MDELIESLQSEEAWAYEIERRFQPALSGEDKGVPWEEVDQQLEADIQEIARSRS